MARACSISPSNAPGSSPHDANHLLSCVQAEFYRRYTAPYEDENLGPVVEIGRGRIANDALAALLQLGETRAMAVGWIDRALHEDPDIEQAEVLISAAYRFKYASG